MVQDWSDWMPQCKIGINGFEDAGLYSQNIVCGISFIAGPKSITSKSINMSH